MTQATRRYRDLQEHLQVLEKRGLVRTIERPIDKDSELHPLVRWQFVGGLDEENRKAFLFTNVTDCLLYTSPSPRDRQKSRMPSSA